MSKVKIISASQVKTYLRCPHRWALRYVDQIEEPETSEALLLGQAFHKNMQRLLQRKPIYSQDEAGKLAARMYEEGNIPEDAAPEIKFLLPKPGYILVGYMDYVSGNIVGDYKTHRQIKKEPPDISNDVQAIIYAHAMCELSFWSQVTCRWHYIRTGLKRKEPPILESEHTFDANEADEKFQKIDKVIRKMLDDKKKHRKELDRCSWCPYHNRGCEKTLEDSFLWFFERGKEDVGGLC